MEETPEINPGYLAGQLAKALRTAQHAADPEAQERALTRMEAFTKALKGLLSGEFTVGSRTPLQDKPAWVTPEVVTGGFVSGGLMAGGPLQPHEEQWCREWGIPVDDTSRLRINHHLVTEAGFQYLLQLLRSHRYAVNAPEEAALPLVAWLATHGHVEAAQEILSEISPFFPQLRFYPAPSAHEVHVSAAVFRFTAGEVAAKLKQSKPKRQVAAQREALTVWAPLHDRVIDLFLETVEGEAPRWVPDANASGKGKTEGGMPLVVIPEGWSLRAGALSREVDAALAEHTLCTAPRDRTRSQGWLFLLLRQLVELKRWPLPGDALKLQHSIAMHLRKWGDARQRVGIRKYQQAYASQPFHATYAHLAAARMSALVPELGVQDVDALCGPVSAPEAAAHGLSANATLPTPVRKKVNKARMATPETLVKEGLVPSADVLAVLLPQVSGLTEASTIQDEDLRPLYLSLYRAFRKRRSLLLWNYESQVKLKELPWARQAHALQSRDGRFQEAAKKLLQDMAFLWITSFPHAILPNKLRTEMEALSEMAGVRLPWLDELAADIFQGGFTRKFRKASHLAEELLKGTLYERYYHITEWPKRMPELTPKEEQASRSRVDEEFGRMILARVPQAIVGKYLVRNGMAIEQQMILTTHNLSTVVQGLGMRERLQPQAGELALRIFQWVLRRMRPQSTPWHGQLILVKNTAYAWRQMVFLLSLLPPDELASCMGELQAAYHKASPATQKRMQPAMDGLKAALQPGPLPEDHVPFLGWTMDKHWAMV